MKESETVLAFWFGRPGEPGHEAYREAWFGRSDAFDAEIRDRFGALHAHAGQGALDHWMAEPDPALALVILLDQFTRNLHRESPQAFANDAKAVRLAKQAVAEGHDRTQPPLRRGFFYLPFEHSEDLAEQERCVALFEAMEEHEGKARSLDFARRHRDVIARFGRFPHRNAVLGRFSTEAERAFLRGHEKGF